MTRTSNDNANNIETMNVRTRSINPETLKFRTAAALKSFQKDKEKVSYYNLRKLAEEGLIEPRQVRSNKRGRNPVEYHLTPKGKDFIEDYINNLKEKLAALQ